MERRVQSVLRIGAGCVLLAAMIVPVLVVLALLVLVVAVAVPTLVLFLGAVFLIYPAKGYQYLRKESPSTATNN